MSSDMWVISDTHFFHTNMLGFVDAEGNLLRPGFSDINEMNEFIVENWNNVVKSGDIVYHLGDVTMIYDQRFDDLWAKLNGRKRLIVGNHDDVKRLARGNYFQKIGMWRQFRDLGLVLSHVPLHEFSLHDFKTDTMLRNVHGHIHHHPDPSEHHMNICVEKTQYTPLHIDSLRIR